MQLGEIIANLCAAILVMCGLAIVFLLAGEPLLPDDSKGKMAILPPPDVMTTASVRAPVHPHLPDGVDVNLLQPRPGRY